mgnify:CR=1 FL=1
MNNWVEVGDIEDIPRRGARVVRTPKGDIAVFRTGTDEIFALQDRCPHKGGPLSQGIVYGSKVTCPLHSRILDLANGRMDPPDEGCAATNVVRVDAGKIFLSL